MGNPDSMLDASDQASTVASTEVAPQATAAEQAFTQAVAAADATRRQAKAEAFTAYVWNSVNLVAYETALADADAAYQTAVKAARDAADCSASLAL